MNRSIPDDVIEEIKQRCDIVEVINSFVPLKKASNDSWKCCCPFHQEKTPSFNVSESRQHYHCFGCGKGGNVFNFIMEYEKVDFPNAVHLLAARCGVIIPENSGNSADRAKSAQRANVRERLYEINQVFCEFYQNQLSSFPDSPVAQYLTSRQLSPEIIAQFQIGAAPDGWRNSLAYGTKYGFSEREMIAAGILRFNSEKNTVYDQFRNRLMFPIWNEQGRVVGFSARTIDKEAPGAKYVNTPETDIFKKGSILYALPLARQAMAEKKFAILCEGQLDTIALHRGGFPVAVAPQGTGFTTDQARILKRYVNMVYLAFDSDKAGVNASLRALEILLGLDFDVKVISIPGGKDPDEIYRNQGEAGIAQLINNAMNMLDFLLFALGRNFDLTTPFGKGDFVKECMKYLNLINNAVARESAIATLAEKINIRSEAVYELLAEHRRNTERYSRRAVTPDAPEVAPEKQFEEAIPANIRHAEKTLLELMLKSEDYAVNICRRFSRQFPAGGKMAEALNLAVGLTLNGEWDSVAEELSKLCQEQGGGEISALLATESDYTGDLAVKALNECLAEIEQHCRLLRQREIMEQMKNEPDESRQLQMLEELMRLDQPEK
ncbi:MAG: DNA primase [Lentisphaeria bacterium]|nr:DNA primase [Lentisphaeria bacterium]